MSYTVHIFVHYNINGWGQPIITIVYFIDTTTIRIYKVSELLRLGNQQMLFSFLVQDYKEL